MERKWCAEKKKEKATPLAIQGFHRLHWWALLFSDFLLAVPVYVSNSGLNVKTNWFTHTIVSPFSFLSAGTHKFLTEGEHLELTAITKEQSGSYECIASNDISNPDVRTVQVTVNCKCQGKRVIVRARTHGRLHHICFRGCLSAWFIRERTKLISLYVHFSFLDPPYISKARSTGTAVGQKGILQCEASAVPRADFEWYKEDRRWAMGFRWSLCLFEVSITLTARHRFCSRLQTYSKDILW